MPVALVAFLAVAVAWALTASPQPAAANTDVSSDEPIGTVTTRLQPGWNLTGWTEDATDIETIFETIPQLEAAYSWDAEDQR